MSLNASSLSSWLIPLLKVSKNTPSSCMSSTPSPLLSILYHLSCSHFCSVWSNTRLCVLDDGLFIVTYTLCSLCVRLPGRVLRPHACARFLGTCRARLFYPACCPRIALSCMYTPCNRPTDPAAAGPRTLRGFTKG